MSWLVSNKETGFPVKTFSYAVLQLHDNLASENKRSPPQVKLKILKYALL